MEILGLDVEDDGADGMVMSLPCRALNGTSAASTSIARDAAGHSNAGCCQESAQWRDGRGSRLHERIADTQAMIANVNRLMAGLGVHDRDLHRSSSGCRKRSRESAIRPDKSGPELQAAAATLQASIRKTFLNSPRGARQPDAREPE